MTDVSVINAIFKSHSYKRLHIFHETCVNCIIFYLRIMNLVSEFDYYVVIQLQKTGVDWCK